MNIKVLFVTLLTAILSAMSISAEAQQEVTLTVSSDGPTKEDATKNALRNAIEQAFGAFVSANTTILNDELVKDEIVTVSNGSIKEYKEISAVQTSDGKHMVTLSATVNLPNLITYAKSHGSECEFAGNTFDMEMKLFELQKQNELKALYNLTDQIEAVLPSMLKHELIVGEPRIPEVMGLGYYKQKRYYPDEKSLKNYLFTEEDQMCCLRFNTELVGIRDCYLAKVDPKAKEHIQKFLDTNIQSTMADYYMIPMTIKWVNASFKSEEEIATDVEAKVSVYESKLNKKELKKFNSEEKGYELVRMDNTKFFKRMTPREYMTDSLTEDLKRKHCVGIPHILLNTLRRISLSDPKEYEKRGIKIEKVYMQPYTNFYFRNSHEEIAKWVQDLFDRIERQFNKFVIVDNTGVKSDFFPQHIEDKIRIYRQHHPESLPYGPNLMNDSVPLMMSSWDGGACIWGTGLFYDFLIVSDNDRYRSYPVIDSQITIGESANITKPGYGKDTPYSWDIRVFIPKEEIGKYSKFWIEPKE